MRPIPGHLPTHPAHSGADAAALALRHAGIEAVFLAERSEPTRGLEQAAESSGGLRSTRLSGEAAAVHAASGYARRTGRAAAVVLGPGASFARAVPALATALLDCVPIVCVCVDTPQAFVGPGACTEWDVMGLSMPATKWAARALHAGEIESRLRRAAAHAKGRPRGPGGVAVPRPPSATRWPGTGSSAGCGSWSARSPFRAGRCSSCGPCHRPPGRRTRNSATT